MKSHFHIVDNVIDKKLQAYIDSKAFTSTKNVKVVIQEIIEAFAKNFTDNNVKKAGAFLSDVNVEMRRKDAIWLAFFAGTLLVSFLLSLFFVLLPPEESTDKFLEWEEIFLTLPALRFCLMLIIALFFIATDVMILRKFKVNYLFIFELDPHFQVTHVQLYRVAMMLLTVFMICFMGEILVTKLNYIFPDPNATFSLVMLIIFMIICFMPFHIFYLKARKELGRTLLHIIAAPFGLVKFRHFFLTDILTSMPYTLKDLGSLVCFYATGTWLTLKDSAKSIHHTYLDENQYLTNYHFAIVFLPLWFRLA